MSSPAAGVRHRGPKDKKRPTTPNPEALTEKVAEKVNDAAELAKKQFRPRQQGGEWDYKLAITVITILAFITRFWGIQHPAQVVFDEVHFGKVRDLAGLRRRLSMEQDAIAILCCPRLSCDSTLTQR
jgi:dolichyl-phosphate-mannose-protein mannosyltransferase